MLSDSILNKNYYKTFVLLWMLSVTVFLFIISFHWLLYGGDIVNMLAYISSMIITMYVFLAARKTAKGKSEILEMIKYIRNNSEHTFQTGEVIDNCIREIKSL